MTINFTPFPKIARLNRNITITEKLDGTNAAVVIVPAINARGIGRARLDQMRLENPDRIVLELLDREKFLAEGGVTALAGDFAVFAQSRNKFVTPGKATDNYGFAGWVQANAEALVNTLGEGTHFGEWWGAGIQRGYGLTGGDKRFSLFNAGRWAAAEEGVRDLGQVPGLGVVPVLYAGPFSQFAVDESVERLRFVGSHAAPGFMRPEGIVVWHEAARQSFQVTLEGDAAPKAQPRRAHDLLPEGIAA